MDYRRIIPCLDTKDGRLVKGIHFVELKELGDPAEAAQAYSQAGADELVLLDITATLEGRGTLIEVVERTSRRISVPLTVGGGIRSIGDIEALFDAGASKVSVNTAAVKNPEFVREAAEAFGGEKITVAIDTRTSSEVPPSRPAWTRWNGPRRLSSSAPGRSCRPAWTPTARSRATTSP